MYSLAIVDFRLLEEMYKMGYDPVVSADLTQTTDFASVFFKKVWSFEKLQETELNKYDIGSTSKNLHS